MKNLTVSTPLSSGTPISRFNAVSAKAINMIEADQEMLEPELIALSGPANSCKSSLTLSASLSTPEKRSTSC